MTALAIVAFLAVSLFSSADALPTLDQRSTTVTTMTSAQELSYKYSAMFASTAYCPPSQTLTWNCGANCEALSGFQPFASGGDGDLTQYWYVGYDPNYTQSVVVAHQGTASDIADLVDADFVLGPFNQTLFPGTPSTLEAHTGFLASQARSAPSVLAAVTKALQATGSKNVLITGHSLGAAIALLDSVYLPLHLPSSTVFTTQVYGLPRVGNPDFANYVDAHVTNLAHITNKLDIVPTVPPQFLGFMHPSNEKHIVTSGTANGDWYACTGQDNSNVDCSHGAVPTLLQGNTADHDGPYGTIMMGCGAL